LSAKIIFPQNLAAWLSIHHAEGDMQPKPFPTEKREYIAKKKFADKKSFEEFWPTLSNPIQEKFDIVDRPHPQTSEGL
jgi:hypothetical protein